MEDNMKNKLESPICGLGFRGFRVKGFGCSVEGLGVESYRVLRRRLTLLVGMHQTNCGDVFDRSWSACWHELFD